MLASDAGTGIRPLGKRLLSVARATCVGSFRSPMDNVSACRSLRPFIRRAESLSPDRAAQAKDAYIAGSPAWTASTSPSRRIPRNGYDRDQANQLDIPCRTASCSPGRHESLRGSLGFPVEHAGKIFVFIPEKEIEPPTRGRSPTAGARSPLPRTTDLMVQTTRYVASDFPRSSVGPQLVDADRDSPCGRRQNSLDITTTRQSDDGLDAMGPSSASNMRWQRLRDRGGPRRRGTIITCEPCR